MPFYAVARGHRPGVYETWNETRLQVDGFRNARHKKFSSLKDAKTFIADNSAVEVSNRNQQGPVEQPVGTAEVSDRNQQGPVEQLESIRRPLYSSKCYGVAKGRVPGVYMNWKDAKEQVEGMYSARFKGFWAVEEAQQFVDDYKRSQEAHPSDPDPRNPSTLVAFTDGSAVKNGQPGLCRAGWACVFPHNPAWHRAGGLPGWRQSNNRAEYWGAIEALRRVNEEDPSRGKPLYIYSDSKLLMRSMTEWVSEWRKQGWFKADGKPVKNSDLLKMLLQEQGERRIIWRFVKAHTNRTDWRSKWNDLADQMAKEQTRNDVFKRWRLTTQSESETGGGGSLKRGRQYQYSETNDQHLHSEQAPAQAHRGIISGDPEESPCYAIDSRGRDEVHPDAPASRLRRRKTSQGGSA